MLWSDSGASGKPGSIWSIGGLQLLGAAQGQTPPGDASWKLKRMRFTLGDGDMCVPVRALPPPDEGGLQSTQLERYEDGAQDDDPRQLGHVQQVRDHLGEQRAPQLQSCVLA